MTDGYTLLYTIPTQPDILIAYSTMEGKGTHDVHPSEGLWLHFRVLPISSDSCSPVILCAKFVFLSFVSKTNFE